MISLNVASYYILKHEKNMYTSLFRSSVKHMSCGSAWSSLSLRIYKAVSTDNQGERFPRNTTTTLPTKSTSDQPITVHSFKFFTQ